ncbi:trifunctional serine/threonine-protein kinase/ATP-binding protein/sensor histidine kinase [Acaryochloris sp. IP29b_bin.137]|uniref:trifunctional serine/threonine-protein kinase/ATP-binding protein/sensor histidine kinase n=1 Tax=Acaryochloris sp. IP29b_bin.137 TaxID=2969217 RepID=UPI00261E9DAF|nr:trifunctional serine/threonine-protein kinase/ATP-binding protein/sensor histidine kinase [Acaryochloris sp. IP29b_bin.137]
MLGTIADCRLVEHLYESANSIVYRGQRQAEPHQVILKVLKEDYPSASEITRYRQEYEITRSLELEGVVKVFGLEPYQRTLAIILEDIEGQSLKAYYQEQAVPLAEFLTIAISIVEILGQIHSQNVIHKDLNPSNVIFNAETHQLRIIDFGISTQLSRETKVLKNPSVLEGTLPYIAPEQTGRMNRSLDYRTDFYALGVMFYELLTGQLPFQTKDPLKLVHCHLAQQPTPPRQVNPDIPEVVSDLIMTLMSKTAEDRYQSAFGIQADLSTCLQQLKQTGEIRTFPLRSQDHSDKFQIPQKLYGREQEISALLTAFERVNHPQDPEKGSEMMLVAGYSGIGKSSLVAEVHKPITEKRGYFISGKYDQFQRDVPYSAVISAFQDLVKQLLTETELQLSQWRQQLLTALGPNGQVVIDVIPEVELITGPQPPVPELGPAEALNRFNLVFQQFIRVFCTPTHPLVVFLDDLQWADSASLKLIKLMMTDRHMRSLLLIGAYRDNEVDATHPLMTLVKRLWQDKVNINTITLQPLSQLHLCQLIADTVDHNLETTLSLAELVLQKTQGNPFFVNEFLKNLYTEQLLQFNSRSQQWEWDIALIRSQDLTDNVIELLISKLKKLPSATQDALRLAACVGAEFDLQTLSLIRQQSQSNVFGHLKVAIQLGLVVARSELNESLVITDFRFGHDRIQQAAYALIDADARSSVHLRIGRLLWHNMSDEQLSDRIFEVVDHLNQALPLITEQDEQTQVAQLNLQAGQKAKSATAYGAAVRYLQTGLALVGDTGWQQTYSLTLKLHEEAVEAAFLHQDYEQQEYLTTIVVEQAKCVLDMVQVYRVKILARSAQNRHLEATDIGFEILERLGVTFVDPTPENLQQELEQTKQLCVNRSIEDLIHLPAMVEDDKLAAMQILSDILSSGYQAVFERFILSNLKQIYLSLRYGNTAPSAFAYDCYGITLCGVVGDIETGYQFGRLALAVVDKFDAKKRKSRVVFVFNAFVRHWTEPLSLTLPDLHEGYQIGLETGDLEYASYSLCWEAMHSLLTGQKLPDLATRMLTFQQAISGFQQAACILYLQIFQQATAHLMDPGLEASRLSGTYLQERQVLVDSADNKLALAFFYTLKAQVAYLLGQPGTALDSTQKAADYVDGMTAAATVASLNFYDSLARLALYDTLPPVEQERMLAVVATNQAQLQKWAAHAPANHQHKYSLVEAERYRVLGEHHLASETYDRAIALAQEHHYPNEAALANELAAQFFFQRQRENFARVYLNEAYYGYYCWGATAKLRQLEHAYPYLQSNSMLPSHPGMASSTQLAAASTIRTTQSLDLASVLQASQAIASEIVLDKLLMTLIKILVRNAGAQVGHLVLNVEGQLLIEASYDAQADQNQVLQSQPIAGKLPSSLLNYVLRTQESVVIREATQDSNFALDEYIATHQPQSILCAPLMNQGQLSGVLYLENNLTTGAFTSERVEILQLLSGQAAIAIDNARLYTNLEEKVAERTQDLSKALEDLKLAQDGLIQSEKMAALGQLIAGVAHEINTPLGAIRSSIEYIANFLDQHLTDLPQFFRDLPPAYVQQFQALLLRALTPSPTLSGRERRHTRKALAQQIATQGIAPAESLASLLLDLGICDRIDDLFPLLAESGSEALLKMVRQFTRVRESTRDIATASDRSAKIVFALKTYARYDHRGEQIEANITDGIDAVLTLYHNQIKHGVTVQRAFNDIPPILCYFDELNQVWTNLIHNALQAMDHQGSLEIEVSQQSDQVCVRITDNGPGVPPELQTKIFEPFFTTKPPGEGSGLGLDIVKKIIDKHQGTLILDSVPGRTTFSVTLPMSITPQPIPAL